MPQYGAFSADIAVTAAAAGGGGILSVANPEGQDLIITRVVVHIMEASDAAGTADVGIGAATTLNDTLIDALDYNAVAVTDNIKGKGTNGLEVRLWPAASFLTISKATGAANAEIGTVGRIYVEYLRTGATAA